MRSFLVRKVNNFTKTQCLRAKVPNTYGTRLYIYIYRYMMGTGFFLDFLKLNVSMSNYILDAILHCMELFLVHIILYSFIIN